MQKLLESLLKFIYQYVTHQFNVSRALPIYIRGLSFILFISYASLLYQFSDLSLLDPPLQSNAYSSYRFIFFSFILFLTIFLTQFCFRWVCFRRYFFSFLWVPFWMLLFNGLLYLSLFVLFPTFMSFQWDILLVEALFFSLILFFTSINSIKTFNRAFATIACVVAIDFVNGSTILSFRCCETSIE